MNAKTIETPTSNSQQPKAHLGRKMLAIISLSALAFVIVIAVLIAQRQLQDSNITAPNAPESNPQAALAPGSCLVEFTVTTQPSPTPTNAPPLQCRNICARIVSSNNTGLTAEQQNDCLPNPVLQPGDEVLFDCTRFTTPPRTLRYEHRMIEPDGTIVDLSTGDYRSETYTVPAKYNGSFTAQCRLCYGGTDNAMGTCTPWPATTTRTINTNTQIQGNNATNSLQEGI